MKFEQNRTNKKKVDDKTVDKYVEWLSLFVIPMSTVLTFPFMVTYFSFSGFD